MSSRRIPHTKSGRAHRRWSWNFGTAAVPVLRARALDRGAGPRAERSGPWNGCSHTQSPCAFMASAHLKGDMARPSHFGGQGPRGFSAHLGRYLQHARRFRPSGDFDPSLPAARRGPSDSANSGARDAVAGTRWGRSPMFCGDAAFVTTRSCSPTQDRAWPNFPGGKHGQLWELRSRVSTCFACPQETRLSSARYGAEGRR